MCLSFAGGYVIDEVGEQLAGEVSPPTGWDMSSFAGLRSILREDWSVNGRNLAAPATQMITVYRFGQWVHAPQRSAAVRLAGGLVYHVLFVYVRNALGFEVPHTATIGRRVHFFHQHGVVLHAYTEIGDDSLVYQGVVIGVRWDGGKPGAYYEPPRIGARCRLGAHCALLGAVRVGDGATIGAHVVVTRDIPAGSSVVPAAPRILRLNEETAP
jgi:serine O-acetyltransferase